MGASRVLRQAERRLGGVCDGSAGSWALGHLAEAGAAPVVRGKEEPSRTGAAGRQAVSPGAVSAEWEPRAVTGGVGGGRR